MRIGHEFEPHAGAVLAQRQFPPLLGAHAAKKKTKRNVKELFHKKSLYIPNEPLGPGTSRADEELLQLAPLFADDESVTALVAQQGVEPDLLLRLLAPKRIQNVHLSNIHTKNKCKQDFVTL